VDEVMAAFRLVELAQSGAERIVVDTAPIGHTLRLLDAADLLDSWIHALDAMVAKARAVSLALVGATAVPAAETLLRDWDRCARDFREFLRAAGFLVVTQSDPVITEETGQLIGQLERRGLRIALVIANRGTARYAHWHAPAFEQPPTGCAGLRAWWESLSLAPATAPPRARVPRQRPATPSVWLPLEPLVLVAGKGGVGKSTCAAALAVGRSAEVGTCLVSADPAGSLSGILGVPVTAEPASIAPALRAWQLDADRALERLRRDYQAQVTAVFEEFGLEHAVALDRVVIERLWGLAPPGLDEIVALTELLSASEECAAVIVDSAPTAHFLRLIAMPQIALDWSHALLRLLLKYRAAGSLEEFTRGVLRFARRTRHLQQRLVTPGAAAGVLVTLDEPVVWAETERLHAAMTAAKIPVAALVINRADAGPLRGHSFSQKVPRILRAPQLAEPPSSGAALRTFLESWELVR
jgi:arsenite-transporting ATPase